MSKQMNNSYIPFKKPGTLTQYTDHQLKELAKCSVDSAYFIENYVRIQHPVRGAIPFNLYPFQQTIVKGLTKYKDVVLLISRQSGKTQTISSYILWYAMFNPDKTILIVANKLNQAIEIMDRIRYSYSELPDWLRDSTPDYNKSTITFSNGSRIVCRATTPDAGRGLSISLLYIDEFAFIRPNMQEAFWTSIQPTLSTGGRCIITSTPNTDSDIFAQVYKNAENTIDEQGNTTDVGFNGFKAYKFTWKDHPERDEEWAKKERAKLADEGRFLREHECISGDSIVTIKLESGEILDCQIEDLYKYL